MPLLDFGSESSEILWMGEAIGTGQVKEGDLCEVRNIVRTADGRGFLIECDYQGETIFDYAWKKGKTGQSLQAMFDDPDMGSDNHLFCKAQRKVKNAVLVAKEAKGCTWELDALGDKEVLNFRPKTQGVTALKTANKASKPSEPSTLQDTSVVA